MATAKKSEGCPKKEIDRLSDLPDNLIHQILAFVDAKVAVQTCVLSKRWLCLWKCVPILNFDSRSFRTIYIFNKFVRRVISGRRQCEPCDLRGLKFHSASSDKSVFDRVIRYAVSHSVEEINLMHRCYLSDELLSCVTLKSLHLERFEIINDLFSSCMNLESLTLNKCYIFEEKGIKISAARLGKLSISKLNDNFHVPFGQIKVVVSCPKLSTFYYEGRCPKVLLGGESPHLALGLSMEGCPVLDRIDIRISGSYKENMEVLCCCLWLKTLLKEMILCAKSLVVRKQGLVVKTILSNDDVRAIVYSEATTEKEEGLWQRGTEQNFDDFVSSIAEWFDGQLWIEAAGGVESMPATMEASLAKTELQLQETLSALESHGIQVTEGPSPTESKNSVEARISRIRLLMLRITLTLESHGIYVPKPTNAIWPVNVDPTGTMGIDVDAQHGADQQMDDQQ